MGTGVPFICSQVDKASHSARILEDVPYLHIIRTPQKPANPIGE